jgi:hypothetical protein
MIKTHEAVIDPLAYVLENTDLAETLTIGKE